MRSRIGVAALVAALLTCALSLGLVSGAFANGSGSTATTGPGNSALGCDGSHNSDTGNGANHSGPYDNTCDGSPSGNGNGNGQATGKPCAGCVGNADDKNPKGQYPNGSDHNAGYECDRNHGIGRTNPAHTGCTQTTVTPPATCTKPNGCDTGGGNGCTTPGGCDHNGGGNGCTTPGGCDHTGNPGNPGGGNETPPATTSTTTPPSGTPPANTTSPAVETPQQLVLGERQTSPESTTSPASSPRSTTSPSSSTTTPPESATQARNASASNGSLPFTGTEVAAVLLAAALALGSGLALRRLFADRA